MKKFLTLLALVHLSFFGFAARLSGTIVDDQGITVPFASVWLVGSNNGTTANEEGNYFLDVPIGTHQIMVRVIGFKTQTKTVAVKEGANTLNFKLVSEYAEMQEVTVRASGEDPAYAIMRKVIAQRALRAKEIKTFESDIYLKGKLRIRSLPDNILGFKLDEAQKKDMQKSMGLDSNNQGIIYLLEQLTHYSYQAPNKTFHEIKAIRTSGDPQGLGFAQMPPIINIYDNIIHIQSGVSKRGFISPANTNAFLHYRFKFHHSYRDDGRMIYKIEVIPKRNFEPLFRGFVYVVDNDWVFQQVDLSVDKRAQLDILDTLKFQQQYRITKKNIWTIQQQIIYPALKIFGLDLYGDFVTNYNHQKVNEAIDPQKFDAKIISTYDSSALDRDSTYWSDTRPMALSEEERKDFVIKDSMRIADSAKKETAAPSSKSFSSRDLIMGFTITSGKNAYQLNGLGTMLSFNTVEGLNLNLNPTWTHRFNRANAFSVSWKNRYGFSNKAFQSLLELNFQNTDTAFVGKAWHVSAQIGQYVFQINPQEPISPMVNMVTSLFWARNHMKLFQNRIGKLDFEKNWGNGLQAGLALSYEQRSPMVNHTMFTWARSKVHQYTPNNPQSLPLFENHKAAIASFTLRFQPAWRYIRYPKYKQAIPSQAPEFWAKYTKAFPNLFGSKSDFDRWSIGIADQVPLKMLGRLDLNLMGGGFLNRKYVGNPDLYHLNGNQTILASKYLHSFQLAPYYQFSSAPRLFGEGHAEWHLQGMLTNKIPLLKRLNWPLVLAGNIAFIDDKQYVGEVSVGLENLGWGIFRFGRIDVVAASSSLWPKLQYGVRIGLQGALLNSFRIEN